MTLLRGLVLTALLLVAVLLQVSVFPLLAYDGVVPDVVLLVVVVAALSRGAELAMVLGFTGGLLLDLAPPADHVAGRWALALVVAGYLAGRVRPRGSASLLTMVAVVAASSFVATSVFALSGLVLRDPAVSVSQALRVIPISVLYDVALAPFVIPIVVRLLGRLEPHRVAYR
jgi:rod shape-determining protein MreD